MLLSPTQWYNPSPRYIALHPQKFKREFVPVILPFFVCTKVLRLTQRERSYKVCVWVCECCVFARFELLNVKSDTQFTGSKAVKPPLSTSVCQCLLELRFIFKNACSNCNYALNINKHRCIFVFSRFITWPPTTGGYGARTTSHFQRHSYARRGQSKARCPPQEFYCLSVSFP